MKSIQSKLKSKLKSVQSKLKSIQSKLKSIEIYHFFDFTLLRTRYLVFSTLFCTQNLLGGRVLICNLHYYYYYNNYNYNYNCNYNYNNYKFNCSYATLYYTELITPHHNYNCNYTTLITLHYDYNSTRPQLQLRSHYNTLHPAVVGEVTTATIATPPKKHNSNHLSVHQWVRSAIRDSKQPISPIGFQSLKLPPPPCAVLLVSFSLLAILGISWDIPDFQTHPDLGPFRSP